MWPLQNMDNWHSQLLNRQKGKETAKMTTKKEGGIQ